MKNSFLRHIPVVLLTLVSLSFVGCMEDNYDDCEPENTDPAEVRLTFVYDFNTDESDYFIDLVDHLDVFVYDSTGTLVESVSLPQDRLENGNALDFSLFPGIYTFVAWGNPDADQFVYRTVESVTEHRLGLTESEIGEDTFFPVDLFHGAITLTVRDMDGRQEETVSMMKNTNRIRVAIQYETYFDDDLRIYMTGSNGHYGADNMPVSELPVLWKPVLSTDDSEGIIYADFSVLRLVKGNDLVLVVEGIASGTATVVLEENVPDVLGADKDQEYLWIETIPIICITIGKSARTARSSWSRVTGI